MTPLPVILVTGFLGSGKTTLLRNWASARPDLRMMFLVNDLSEAGVDADRMRRQRPDIHSVVGGSIFCECKAADFLRMLSDDVLPTHQAHPLDVLVVETSGIADPMAIGTLLEKSGHSDVLQVRSVMTVIAPRKFLRSIGRLPVVDAQVRAADLIVLNKTDTASEEELAACERKVSELNPDAELVRSEYARDIPLPTATRTTPLPGAPLGKCSALAFSSLRVRPRLFVDKEELMILLKHLPEEVMRIKGTLWAEGETMDMDVTPDTQSLSVLRATLTTETVSTENSLPDPAQVPDVKTESLMREPYGLDVIGSKDARTDLEAASESLRSRPALIACDVFKEEVEVRNDLPEFSETVWLPMGLHDRPDELKEKVQAEIDRMESNPDVTEILLLYALCGTGTAGLRSSRVPMILPRAHDCIAFLLGSSQQHHEIQSRCAGTYFYAPGWIREKRVPGPDRESWLREEYRGRFDDDMIDELVEADCEAFEHYEKALFIRTPAAGKTESYCQRCAAHLGWSFESVQGDEGWMNRFFHGPYPASEFVILKPGETVEPSADDQILRVVPAT